jgi:hypothetical protein
VPRPVRSTTRPKAGIRLTQGCEPGVSRGAASCQAVGPLVSTADGTITLASEGSVSAHSLDATSRIDVSRGVRSHWRAGAAVGFVAGGVAGARLGALVGGLVKTERWRAVRLDALHLALDPGRSRLHVRRALSF